MDWKNALISPETKIIEAIKILDEASMQICLVVNEERHLLGTLTDGDIRRGILKGLDLSSSVNLVMNQNPTFANIPVNPQSMRAMMKKKQLHQIPLIDQKGCVSGLETIDHFLEESEQNICVVLMAGGFGKRLQPLTKKTPKPMLKVQGKPLLEVIIERFAQQNFRDFYISVHYKADQIKRFFGDGSRWNVNIRYLHETEGLGTAGGLSLIEDDLKTHFLVMNADLITDIDFRNLIAFHSEQESHATMCVREYDMEVPYGVVNIDGTKLVGIDEKPVHRFLVNAGVYMFDPCILPLVPNNQYLDMPALFDKIVAGGLNTAVFPILEKWLDIGRHEEYALANDE